MPLGHDPKGGRERWGGGECIASIAKLTPAPAAYRAVPRGKSPAYYAPAIAVS